MENKTNTICGDCLTYLFKSNSYKVRCVAEDYERIWLLLIAYVNRSVGYWLFFSYKYTSKDILKKCLFA